MPKLLNFTLRLLNRRSPFEQPETADKECQTNVTQASYKISATEKYVVLSYENLLDPYKDRSFWQQFVREEHFNEKFGAVQNLFAQRCIPGVISVRAHKRAHCGEKGILFFCSCEDPAENLPFLFFVGEAILGLINPNTHICLRYRGKTLATIRIT